MTTTPSIQTHAAINVCKKANFLYYIHNFRGFAILAIVAHHVIISLEWKNSGIEDIVLLLIGNGSVYFVFIAGFLFQFLSSKYEYKSYSSPKSVVREEEVVRGFPCGKSLTIQIGLLYLFKKLQYVIAPYILVSLPAILLTVLESSLFSAPDWFITKFSGWPLAGQIVMYLLTGSLLSQFWFIPMITIFYLVSPLLIWVDRHPRFYWILPALLVITAIVPRPEESNAIQSFLHFASIYVGGMFCSHYREKLLPLIQKRYLLFLSLVVLLSGLQYWFKPDLETFNSLAKLVLSLLIMCFLWAKESQLPQIFNRSMGFVAELSFGIYFLHEYFIVLLPGVEKRLGLNNFPTKANLLSFLLNYLVVLGASIGTILIIKKILGKNSRFLVGC
ncbi:acyltransferase family protein [Leptodesmis sichuanensis]|uniref:acyltransferase family protein n=1 Tax=Leptodesmis sichuanensis TaxID=2906798 RepID=UPI001F1EAC5A|nr:acyltransferase [Leptodesmis sichuanensis]UIE39152.1 acyltransferase [Leptodesmis sichuanensis A121]